MDGAELQMDLREPLSPVIEEGLMQRRERGTRAEAPRVLEASA